MSSKIMLPEHCTCPACSSLSGPTPTATADSDEDFPSIPNLSTLHHVEHTLVSTATADSGFFSASASASQLDVLPHLSRWVPDRRDPHRSRSLVLCFDGTGDQFDDDNSNVIQFLSCLRKDDQHAQLVYYQAGIGTYTKSTFVTPVTNKVSKVLDEMIAWNLSAHVQEGYEFLMQNYTAGDKVCIFGFSRGAYTARALAGMVQKVGLLPRDNAAQIPFAWAMYTRDDKDGLQASEGFKKTFSTPVVIDFVGVWDTVASVGIVAKELPFTASNGAIRVFRHAIALDEHRVKFLPNFCARDPQAEPRRAQVDGAPSLEASIPATYGAIGNNPNPNLKKNGKPRKNKDDKSKEEERRKKKRDEMRAWEAEQNAKTGIVTNVEEVWFAGCHCDIGGGSVKNGTRFSLARIPLRWMIRECFRAQTGIIFDREQLKTLGLDARTVYPVVLPRPSRVPAHKGDTIAQPEKKEEIKENWGRTTLMLLWIPISTSFRVLFFPVEHFWLLLKFTRMGKVVRKGVKTAWKGVKSVFGWVGSFFPRSKTKRIAGEGESEPLLNGSVRHSVLASNDSNDTNVYGEAAEETSAEEVNEEYEEFHDSLSPIYDQLSLSKFWWFLEVIPFRFREQKGKRDDYFVRANFGRGRKIYGDAKRGGIKVHRSVRTRLEAREVKEVGLSGWWTWIWKKGGEGGEGGGGGGGGKYYKPRAWFKYRPAPGMKKEMGPKQWNVDAPERGMWEWVE